MEETLIASWIKKNAVRKMITAPDGVCLNTYHTLHDDAKGTIVMVHGFCEFFWEVS